MADNRFWRWYDRGSRADFGGTLLGFIFDWKGWIAGAFSGSGGAMIFIKAAIDGRSPLDVWVLALVVVAALVAIVYFSISILEKYKKSGRIDSGAIAPHEDFSDEMRSNIYQKIERLLPEAKHALYRVATAEIEADQLNVEMKGELDRSGFVKPGVGYAPAEFIERYRPFILQWFREQTHTVLSISGPHVLRETRYKYQCRWRMKLHNAGPATAINPQMKLRSANPGPNDAGWNADYPYPIARVGHTLDEPEYQINPGDDENFEVVMGWKNEGGQLFVTLSQRDARPISIDSGERWNFTYEITVKNAPSITFKLQVFRSADEVNV